MFSKPIEPPMKIWVGDFNLKTKQEILNQAKSEGWDFGEARTTLMRKVGGFSFDSDGTIGWWGKGDLAKERYNNAKEREEIFWHLKPTRTIDASNLF